MFTIQSSSSNLNRTFTRSLIVGTLTAMGILLGVAPDFSGQFPRLTFNSSAFAQDISSTQARNYARALLAMEPLRQSAYAEIKKIVGNVPPISCSQSGSLSSLPRNAREIAVNYCNRSKEIVESNSLSVSQFNLISVTVKKDPGLRTQIQNYLTELQR